jgi:hypothetical protein
MDIEREAHWEPAHPDFIRARQAADNEVPVSVAFNAVLALTNDLAVFVSGLRVFSNGVELAIEVRARKLLGDTRHGLSEAVHGVGRPGPLVGVEFSDGRRGSNVERDLTTGPRDAPTFWPGGGQGGQRTANLSLFLSPLPPPGDLRFVFAWPGQGIQETFTPLPTDRILDAARQVRQLWPWEPEEQEELEPIYPDLPEGSWFAAEVRRPR